MEEQVVEILLKAWGDREPTDQYSCIDLCLVNLETENVRSYGGDKLYGGRPSSAMVPLGDDIYIVGNDALDIIKKTLRDDPDIFVHSTVSRINVNDFDGGWKNVTPFNTSVMGYDESRMFPSVALNNKLYVFGDTFGQVYDPKSPTQWTSLPPVPLPAVHQGNINHRRISIPGDSVSLVGTPVIADSGKNRIILHLPRTDSIYAYYPNKRCWECLVEDFDSWSDITVLFDNMLLFYYPVKDLLPIQAYDLETNKWLKPVSAPESDPDIIYKHCAFFDAIIPMEQPRGTFYLAASRSYCSYIDGTTFTFVKFTVDRPNKSEDLVFNFVSSQKLHFNWPCLVCSYLPVVGKMSKIKDTLEEVSVPMDIGASSFEKHCATQRSSKRANDNVVDCSSKSTAQLVNPTDIWKLLKDMEVVDNTACYNFLVKDPSSLIILHACPIQKRKKVLEILMGA